MFFDKSKMIEKKIHELSLEVERQNKEIANLFEKLGFTPDELKLFLENPKNFPPEIFELLEKERHRIEKMQAKNIGAYYTPPIEMKNKMEERKKIAPHWIFCR